MMISAERAKTGIEVAYRLLQADILLFQLGVIVEQALFAHLQLLQLVPEVLLLRIEVFSGLRGVRMHRLQPFNFRLFPHQFL